jgi:flagellar motor switch protein FliM
MPQIVQEVPVLIVAELGRLKVGLRSLLELQVGQVLRLSTAVDDPVRIEVEGLKKFFGSPVVSRGQLAVEIKGRTGE